MSNENSDALEVKIKVKDLERMRHQMAAMKQKIIADQQKMETIRQQQMETMRKFIEAEKNKKLLNCAYSKCLAFKKINKF
jgi:predicted transcriptional regulator